jgi:hypothetical protein
MHNWQKDLWAACTGSDPREMKIYMGGRNMGKSVMAQMWNIMQEETQTTYCRVITQAKVDNKPFYTIQCSKPIADWIREQPGENTQWYQHIDQNWYVDRTMFDIDEEFYLMLKLRWGC